MSLLDTRPTNFVLSELFIWTEYLQYALQRMYEVAGEIAKEALKDDLAVAEAKLASNNTDSRRMKRSLDFVTSSSCYNNK